MKNKSLSTLGYIMNSLNIQTVSMSHSIHVDASLVSKWKTGGRNLSEKSPYFDDVVTYILEESAKTNHTDLKSALLGLYPHENMTDASQLEKLLRKALSVPRVSSALSNRQSLLDGIKAVSALVFEANSGRRDAIRKLLQFAEDMAEPGEIIFIDSEAFGWMLEDKEFSTEFTERVTKLLQRGFHAKFMIHYSSYQEIFVSLFYVCSPLIFHRNVEWHYYKYYDDAVFNISFFILNRAVSMLGLSVESDNSTTMVFTDNALVLRHEALAKDILNKCSPLFTNFDFLQIGEVVDDVYRFRKKGTMYSLLPVPAFITVRRDLIKEVLRDNDVDEEKIRKCMELNRKLCEITSGYLSKKAKKKEPFIYIFSLEEMIKRAANAHYVSRSLTLLSGKKVTVLPRQYARVLRDLANDLMKYDNMQIVLISERDSITLPVVNCWCKQNSWMVHMDKEGFRISDEVRVINAASTTLERCIRMIPPERREKSPVSQYLLELAEELELES